MNAATPKNSGGLLNTVTSLLGFNKKNNIPKNTNVNIAITATPNNAVMAIEEVKTNQPLAGGKRKATRKGRKARKTRKNKKASRRSKASRRR